MKIDSECLRLLFARDDFHYQAEFIHYQAAGYQAAGLASCSLVTKYWAEGPISTKGPKALRYR